LIISPKNTVFRFRVHQIYALGYDSYGLIHFEMNSLVINDSVGLQLSHKLHLHIH
jgi:hypothetical protein